MRGGSKPEQLFNQGRLSDALEHQIGEVRDAVNAMPREELLAASEDELTAQLVERFRAITPELQLDDRHVEQVETQIDVRHDRMRDVRDRSRPALIPAVSVSMTVPFRGDAVVLRLRASQFKLTAPTAVVTNDAIVVTTGFPRDSAPVIDVLRQRLDSQIAAIQEHLSFSRTDIDTFNESLVGEVRGMVSRRRQQLLGDEDRLAALGFPVSGPQKPPQTYSAPSPQRRRRRVPTERSRARPPEPTMAQRDYDDLLGVIRDVGRGMERAPTVYAGDDEEKRRHHLLLAINSHFPGAGYAEAFNGRGKTDILVRHDGHNLFIGECKIWRGPQEIERALDQLLGYATYHDTKLALIVFVDGAQMSRAVEAGIKRCRGPAGRGRH